MASMAVQQIDGSFLTISEHGSSIERHNNSIRLSERLSYTSAYSAAHPCASKKSKILHETELTQEIFLRQLLRRYSELTKTSTALSHLAVLSVLSVARRLVLIFVNSL